MLRLWYKFLLAILPYYERSPSCLVGSLFFLLKAIQKIYCLYAIRGFRKDGARLGRKQIWIRRRHKQNFDNDFFYLASACWQGREENCSPCNAFISHTFWPGSMFLLQSMIKYLWNLAGEITQKVLVIEMEWEVKTSMSTDSKSREVLIIILIGFFKKTRFFYVI